MAKWEELPIADRAKYMEIAVKNGYRDIRSIREAYNQYAKGGPKEKMDKEEEKELSLLEKAKLFVSSNLMNSFRNIRNNIVSNSEGYNRGIEQNSLYRKSNYDDVEDGVPQATYLMDRDTQRKVFLRKGYLEGKKGDYGIVKRAVGYRDIPVYQTEPDDIDRSQLIPIGNVKNLILKNANDSGEDILKRNLKHAGTYSGTIYLGTDGNLYGKNWDLNDYGPDANGKGGDVGFMDFATRTLDSVGSPTVITTGFKRLDNVDWMIDDNKPIYLDLEQRKKYFPKYAEEWFEQHPEIQYLPETGKFQYTLPEVIVTAPKKKANGGELYFLDKPFSYKPIPSVRYDYGGNTREQSIRRANYVASNYDDAKDFDMNPIVYAARKAAKDLIDKGGLSNCTLSATQWIDPSNPYMSARNIFNNPDSGYTEIDAENALPGDLLITKNPEHGTYHTMLIEGFDKNNKPLLRYSRGGHDTEENLVTGRTLEGYHIVDKAQGGNHTEDHYFRPNVYNEHWLPEVVVTAQRRR